VKVFWQNDRCINHKRMSLHRIMIRPPEQLNILNLAQKRSPMVYDQRKETGAACDSCSAILYQLGIGFRALNPGYHFGGVGQRSMSANSPWVLSNSSYSLLLNPLRFILYQSTRAGVREWPH
jgi:hypothetical protein